MKINNEQQISALYDFAQAAQKADMEYVLVGAGARLLVLDGKYNELTGRATDDWDLAIQVRSWEEFDKAKAIFWDCADSRFSKDGVEHRIRHNATGIPMDIIPFGEIAEDGKYITWPKDEAVMTVAGFQEAYDNCERVKVRDISLRVASEPCLAMMKVFAFDDRDRRDDMEDFFFILNNYLQDDTRDEAMDLALDQLIDESVEFDNLGPYLLGHKLGSVLTNDTYQTLKPLLDKTCDPYSKAISTRINQLGDDKAEEQKRNKLSKQILTFHNGILRGMKERT